MLEVIESQRLYQKVADQIARLIREGHWGVAERLPSERELAQQLGVSRPTVREAMIALELLGLVEVRTGAGIYVSASQSDPSFTLREIEDPGPSPFDLVAARRVIEGETAAIAAREMTPEMVQGLYGAIEKMEADIDKQVQLISSREDGDRLFHSRIAAATNNSVLQSIVEQLWEGMRRPIFKAICQRVRMPENARQAAGEHHAIYERIAAGDSDGARAAMHVHLDQVERVLLKNEEHETGATAATANTGATAATDPGAAKRPPGAKGGTGSGRKTDVTRRPAIPLRSGDEIGGAPPL
jgi:DNA-binding FadR family transcriptional regulator